MDKNRLTDELNQVQVPASELQEAIKNGIARAKKEKGEKPLKKKTNIIRSSGIAAAVTIGVLGSGFIFPQMSGILANFPYLDKVYSTFHDTTGETLSNKDLVTELNEEVVSNGIAVKATSAYYDNRKITVTFEVDKEDLKMLEEDIKKFSFDFELTKDEYNWKTDPKVSVSFNTDYDEEKGYMIIELTPPDDIPSKSYTLPITLTNVGGTEGEWEFNISVEQLENKEVSLDGQKSTDKNGDYTVTFDKIIHGQGSTIIEYTILSKYEPDSIQVDRVFDQNGKEYKSIGGPERDVELVNGYYRPTYKKVGERFEFKHRTTFEKIPEDINFFTMEISHHRSEADAVVALNKLPQTIKSKRIDAQVSIKNAEVKDRKLAIDYEIQVGDKNIQEDLLGDSLQFVQFSLYETEFLKTKKGGTDIPEKGTFLKWNQDSAIINKDKGHVQAIFDLDGDDVQSAIKNFDLDEYSIKVPMHVWHGPPASVQKFKVDMK
jgi:hypothetical protein